MLLSINKRGIYSNGQTDRAASRLHKNDSLMPKSSLKRISFILAALATTLLIIIIVQFIMVFKTDTETGILDFLPPVLRMVIFISYPIFLFSAYLLFFLTKQIENKLNSPIRTLIFSNGIILLILIIYLGTRYTTKAIVQSIKQGNFALCYSQNLR